MVTDVAGDGSAPEIPIQVIRSGFGFRHVTPRVREVVSTGNPSRPDMGFNRSTQLIAAQHFNGLHAPLETRTLIAHLSHQIRTRGKAFTNHPKFVQLMHQGFLAIHVLSMGHGSQHHGSMVEIGSVHDNGVECIRSVGKGFAVIMAIPCIRVVLTHLVEHQLIHITKADET